MAGQPAAVLGDLIACPIPQATPAALPHAPPPGLPIIPVPPGSPPCVKTMIDDKPPARVGGEGIMCITPAPVPNPILRGAFPVPIENKPAARLTDQATHPGSMISVNPGRAATAPKTLIGLAGTSGNPWAGTKDCMAVRATRATPGSPTQGAENCGIESSRQVLNRAGNQMSEAGLLAQAQGSAMPGTGEALAGTVPGNWAAGGTSTLAGNAQLLTNNGVPSTFIPGEPYVYPGELAQSAAGNMQAIEQAVAGGQGVITSANSGALYGVAGGGNHAIQVTGIEYDENGNPVTVIINDTANPNGCGQPIPYNDFMDAMMARGVEGVTTTDAPIY